MINSDERISTCFSTGRGSQFTLINHHHELKHVKRSALKKHSFYFDMAIWQLPGQPIHNKALFFFSFFFGDRRLSFWNNKQKHLIPNVCPVLEKENQIPCWSIILSLFVFHLLSVASKWVWHACVNECILYRCKATHAQARSLAPYSWSGVASVGPIASSLSARTSS